MSVLEQLKPGELLQHGKYRISNIIGKGGMGRVYLATHVMLGREIVLRDCRQKAIKIF
jgi:serine/threonine protein kinase